MKIELYNFGAYIEGEMNDNEVHSHECIQISRSKNNCYISIKEKEVFFKAGETILIAAKVQHSLPNNHWCNILVDNECIIGEELELLIGDKSHIILKENKTINELMNNPKVSLTHIKENIRDEVKSAITIIGEHDHNCDLKEISKKVSLSADRFRKVFKEEMGITFKNYLRWKKIKKAFTLLNQPKEIKLVDIAHSSGFSDQAHMSKIIKETFGYNPKVIKNNL